MNESDCRIVDCRAVSPVSSDCNDGVCNIWKQFSSVYSFPADEDGIQVRITSNFPRINNPKNTKLPQPEEGRERKLLAILINQTKLDIYYKHLISLESMDLFSFGICSRNKRWVCCGIVLILRSLKSECLPDPMEVGILFPNWTKTQTNKYLYLSEVYCVSRSEGISNEPVVGSWRRHCWTCLSQSESCRHHDGVVGWGQGALLAQLQAYCQGTSSWWIICLAPGVIKLAVFSHSARGFIKWAIKCKKQFIFFVHSGCSF